MPQNVGYASSALKMFKRNSSLAQKVSGGLFGAAARVGRTRSPYDGGRSWL